ncbi:MAG: ester cyclase [Anaerolineae bacterium]|nr:ester cyclase [Anaerolineae bacterium]
MDTETNKRISREVLERGFNQGDVTVFDEYMDPAGVDHQEPPGTNFIEHLKDVVVRMRTAFPDLHFEIHDILAEGDIVAFRSTMTGTHSGLFDMVPGRPIPATGRRLAVPHMHFVRVMNGKTTDLWHLWNIPMMMMQIGAMPQPQPSHM